MRRSGQTLRADYFESIYAADPDPWRFASSDYERRKYATTLSALPRARYASGLEVGCSIGVLTEKLAAHCGRLLGVDAVALAIDQARRRCVALPGVHFAKKVTPRQWPGGLFDLIVLSEILYYFDAADVALVARRVAGSLADQGDIVLVHWTGPTNYPLSGDDAVELFIQRMGASTFVLRSDRSEKFRLDILGRRDARLQPRQQPPGSGDLARKVARP